MFCYNSYVGENPLSESRKRNSIATAKLQIKTSVIITKVNIDSVAKPSTLISCILSLSVHRSFEMSSGDSARSS